MLPLNFHRTFIPERHFIAALIEYAALERESSLQEISQETGIPMGKSTGKLPAIMDYCKGMGLIELKKSKDKGNKRPVLTPLGKIIYEEDKYLGEVLSQWLVHINLCRSDIGARVWHEVFAKGKDILGVSFTKQQLSDYLISISGVEKDRIGPLITAYTDDSALGRAKVLTINGDLIVRNKAPIMPSWAIPYSVLIITLIDKFFPNENQVTITDFNNITHMFSICSWQEDDIVQLLYYIEAKGLVAVDRQVKPWILEKRADAEKMWASIFNDIT
jgi:hypothetical protein